MRWQPIAFALLILVILARPAVEYHETGQWWSARQTFLGVPSFAWLLAVTCIAGINLWRKQQAKP